MKRIITTIFALVALAAIAHSQTEQAPSFRPKEGFVPSAETAAKVGEAVLMPVYGEKRIVGERPFKATLQGDVWTVEGTLHCDGPPDATCLGGTAVVKISKTSGQILFMMHYK
jgi:NTF2 fold immunity protein of polymorphic toxin system component